MLENYACRTFGSEYITTTLFSTLSCGVIDFVIGSKMAAWQQFWIFKNHVSLSLSKTMHDGLLVQNTLLGHLLALIHLVPSIFRSDLRWPPGSHFDCSKPYFPSLNDVSGRFVPMPGTCKFKLHYRQHIMINICMKQKRKVNSYKTRLTHNFHC